MHIANGRLLGARQFASENRDARPADEISLIVIHCISLPEGHFNNRNVQQLFCNELDCSVNPEFHSLEGVHVSSHLVITRDGSLEQYVSFLDRAWHAGESNHGGRHNCNDFSVGIELIGSEASSFDEAQYGALGSVCRLLCATYGIDAIVGHSDIAPGRKTDPGPEFDWARISGITS